MNEKLHKIRELLKQEKIDAIGITNLYNIRYLTGFTGTYASLIISQKKAWFFTDSRYLEYVKSILPSGYTLMDVAKNRGEKRLELLQKNNIEKLGFESNDVSLHRFEEMKRLLKKITLKSIPSFIEKLRVVKSEEEIGLITKAQRIAEKTLQEIIKKHLKNGVTEIQIAWEIERLGHEFGAETISFAPIIGFGPNSAIPHHQNTTRKFKKGDVVLIDMGMKYKGYCSDMTRTFFTKEPSALQKKVYNIVLEAQEMGIKKIKPGATGKEIDAIARSHIAKAGYGEKFGHSYGHGIGLEVHEAPTLSYLSQTRFPENTIVTAEPGIYLEGQFGVRIEDMCLITKNGAKNLTKHPKMLTVLDI